MTAFRDLYSENNLAGAKEFVLGLYQAFGGTARGWLLGWPTERWIDLLARVAFKFDGVQARAIRGAFWGPFDDGTPGATDPGDPGDTSPDQTPRASWASALGAGWYGTTRREQLFAEGTVTLTNTGGSTSSTFTAADITVQNSVAASDGGFPTYHGVGSTTITLAPSASVTINIIADEIGIYSNASPGDISICQTQSFCPMSVTNPNSVLGSEREPLVDYRARSKSQTASLSPGGPFDAYRRAANTAKDGSPLQRHDGSGAVDITKVYVSKDSATGDVTVYYANASGGAAVSDVDRDTANANITGVVLGSLTDPEGVFPDTVSLLPLDPGGEKASDVTVNVTWTAEIPDGPGIDATTIQNTANAAIATWFGSNRNPINGVDVTTGTGYVRPNDILLVIGQSYPGLYNVVVSSPGSPVAIGVGEIGAVGTTSGTVTPV